MIGPEQKSLSGALGLRLDGRMKILILGGTAWLSRQIAALAAEAGHDVCAAARGISGPAPAGARFVTWDRSQDAPEELTGCDWDAVIDVTGNPAQLRRAVEALRSAHWVFISTISVYSDLSRPLGIPESTPVLAADYHDGAPESGPMYGAMKVACEETLCGTVQSWTVLRPGVIVGPGDPTGRLTYWPLRMAEASADEAGYLAPLPDTAPVQWIDVRDLAEWTVDTAEQALQGIYDAVCPPVPRREFLSRLAQLQDPAPAAQWASPERLAEFDVKPWAGPRSLPFWVPWQGWEQLMGRDAAPAAAAGLRLRSLEDTALDIAAWVAESEAATTGLTRSEEFEVLNRLRGTQG